MTFILSKECCDCQEVDDGNLGPCDDCEATCSLITALNSRTENCHHSPPGIAFNYTFTPTLNGLTLSHYTATVYDNTNVAIYGPHNIGQGISIQYPAESAPTTGWYVIHTLHTVEGTTCDSAPLPVDLYGALIWSSGSATFNAYDRLAYALNPCANPPSTIAGTYTGTVRPCASGNVTVHKVELILDSPAGASVVGTVLHPNGLVITSAGTTVSIPYTSTPIAYNPSSPSVPYQIKLYELVGQVYVEVAHGPTANTWWQGNYGNWWSLYHAANPNPPVPVNSMWSGVAITAPISGAEAKARFPWPNPNVIQPLIGNTASNSSSLIELSCHTPINLNVAWDFQTVPDNLTIQTCVAYGAIANGVPNAGWQTLFTTGNVNGSGSTSITTPSGHSWMKISILASQSNSKWTVNIT